MVNHSWHGAAGPPLLFTQEDLLPEVGKPKSHRYREGRAISTVHGAFGTDGGPAARSKSVCCKGRATGDLCDAGSANENGPVRATN
jgi:hypothetical protein